MSRMQERRDQPMILLSLWRGAVPRYSSMRDIIEVVARKHNMSVSEMLSPSRKGKHVRARQEAMYEMHLVGKWSYPQISRALRLKDHSTSIWGVKAHKKRIAAE